MFHTFQNHDSYIRLQIIAHVFDPSHKAQYILAANSNLATERSREQTAHIVCKTKMRITK